MRLGEKKAQAWSIDLIIAIVIFVLVITIFYTLLVKEPEVDVNTLKLEARDIEYQINTNTGGTNPCAFLTKTEIDKGQLIDCFNDISADPNQTKRDFNLKSNFCIYLVDQNNNVISINNGSNDMYRAGAGFGDVNISGIPCGEVYNSSEKTT